MSRGKCPCADARTANSAQGNDGVAYCPSAPAAAPDSRALSSASSLASAAADAALRSSCQRASCAAIDSYAASSAAAAACSCDRMSRMAAAATAVVALLAGLLPAAVLGAASAPVEARAAVSVGGCSCSSSESVRLSRMDATPLRSPLLAVPAVRAVRAESRRAEASTTLPAPLAAPLPLPPLLSTSAASAAAAAGFVAVALPEPHAAQTAAPSDKAICCC